MKKIRYLRKNAEKWFSVFANIMFNNYSNTKSLMKFTLRTVLITIILIGMSNHKNVWAQGENKKDDVLIIKKSTDFEISGAGSAEEWSQTDWVKIPRRTTLGKDFLTKVKMLYSNEGIYFLFYCEDEILSSTMNEDFLDLWNEDVVEVFLWPDEDDPAYFEYEISPLNHELPLLIYNDEGTLISWLPFHYDGERKTFHATDARGGEKKSKATVDSWTAEFFIPYKAMRPLRNVPPHSGTKWRGNMYRIDYDSGQELWSWQLTGGNFHDYKKFGTLIFE